MKTGSRKQKIENILLLILVAVLVFSVGGAVYRMKETGRGQEEMKLVLYEGPTSLKDATADDIACAPESDRDITLKHCVDTKITVDGQECYVYDTNVNHTRCWVSNYKPPLSRTPIAYFDFEGRADIELTVPERDLSKVTVSPLSYGIKPVVDEKRHTVSFSIDTPDTYTVMFGDSPERAVHIFANPLETDVPDFNDENVIYIGPGEWDIDAINLEDGQTLYLSGGAVVHGAVNANYAKNVTVMGRGIIDGSKLEGWMGQTAYIPLKFDHCENVKLQDVIVLNANAWVCQGYDTKTAQLEGLKIVSARPNGDGITLQSCLDVEVKNCFVRSWDDSLVVKNYDGNTKNIQFSNIQVWTDFAQSMEIGFETNKGQRENAAIMDVRFDNICVLHNFHKPVISVHNADDALVSDIIFQNIVVEDAQMGSGDGDEMPYLIDLCITQNSNWSSTKERGRIENVLIDHVTVLSGKKCVSRIAGFDEEHKVSDVSISNLNILGEAITDFDAGQFEIDWDATENLKIQ